ncbi:MAG: HDOD domain-containing protein [Solirubrobacterales bacterium]
MGTASQNNTASPPAPKGKGGRRLAAAFDAVTTLPALAETTTRVAKLTMREGASMSEISEVVESDTAVAIAVMRAANNGGGPRGRISNVPDAVEALTPAGVGAVAAALPTYELFRPGGSWAHLPERFRRHAVATRNAAESLAQLADVPGRDELATAALLHDVGQLVLMHLHPGYEAILGNRQSTPEARTQLERRELGIDHTLVGGVLVRRWGFPSVIAGAIERHHSDSATGLAAAVRLSDLIAHHAAGDMVSGEVMNEVAGRCGLSEAKLQNLVYEFPHARAPRQRRSEPCPLSRRETDALRGLAEGHVYKEIAIEMGLSASTVRTHLHNVYRKIGAADRAQAVLVGRERGWI